MSCGGEEDHGKLGILQQTWCQEARAGDLFCRLSHGPCAKAFYDYCDLLIPTTVPPQCFGEVECVSGVPVEVTVTPEPALGWVSELPRESQSSAMSCLIAEQRLEHPLCSTRFFQGICQNISSWLSVLSSHPKTQVY